MYNFSSSFNIDGVNIGKNYPAYFIADIAANHDGELNRAIDLIHSAAESGANAAKFQHFNANTIVSDHGFRSLKSSGSHQSSWDKSVYQVYEDASLKLNWTQILKQECKKANISFFTSPYSIDLVDYVDEYVPAYKIGSGDITWLEIIEYIASKNKPTIIASGASNLDDVKRAIFSLVNLNKNIALLQCNTNYTGEKSNFNYINLNVLDLYKKNFPDLILGLSDHTPGHSTVLGAIAKGAKIIEKHFTDDITRKGPDHKFSLNKVTWNEMVQRSRELELSLGNGNKIIEDNEKDTVILQRRSIRLKKDLYKNQVLQISDLEILRPCPIDAIMPYEINNIKGKKIKKDMKKGEYLKWIDLT